MLPGDNPMTLEGTDIRPNARVFVDGVWVTGTITCLAGVYDPYCTTERIEILLDVVPSGTGMHFVQLQNQDGPISNEMPFCVGNGNQCD